MAWWPPRSDRSQLAMPWLLAAIGLAVRIVLILAIGSTSLPPAANDNLVYYDAARNLSQSWGAWVRPIGQFGYRAPLYFVYLAGWFRADPELSYRSAQMVTSLLGVLTALVLFAAGRRLGGAKAAWWSLVLRLFLPCFVVSDTFVMSEPLFSLAFASAILAFVALVDDPRSIRWSLALGASLAAAMLTRESASLLPLLFIAGVLALAGTARQRLARAGWCALALAIVLLPWAARNQVVWGKPLPIAHTAGVNLYIGNNPEATGIWGQFRPVAPPGIAIGTPEASAWYARAAAEFVIADPARFLAGGLRKLAWFLFPVFHRDSMQAAYGADSRAVSWLSLASGASSALLLLLGALALVRAPRGPVWWMAVAILACQMAIVFVAFGSPRFRDPVDHLLVLFIAAGAEPWTGGRRCAAAVGLAWLAIGLAWGYVAWVKLGG
jgi:4-amino-4-deoxy-L-arabinose transferase-like glycosyltransferase